MYLHVTHVDDSHQARLNPCFRFWALNQTRNNEISVVQHYLEEIKPLLGNATSVPFNLHQLQGETCCAYIKDQWRRIKFFSTQLDSKSQLEVICIDTGETRKIPLMFIFSLDQFQGNEAAKRLKEAPALATQYELADVLAPRSPGMSPMWSDQAMYFLKTSLEDKTWKATIIGTQGSVTGVRLHCMNNGLLATLLIQANLGVPSQSYEGAVLPHDETSPQSTYNSPAYSPTTMGKYPQLLPAYALPAACRNRNLPFASATALLEAAMSPRHYDQRSYLTSHFPCQKRISVVITHAPEGPLNFTVQLLPDSTAIDFLQSMVQSQAIHSFACIPSIGAPCLVLSTEDNMFHRAMIAKLNEANQFSVKLVDTGRTEVTDLSRLRYIPDDLLRLPPFSYRVSLEDAEKMASYKGVIEVFNGIVASTKALSCEAIPGDPDRVVLFDHRGRSVREVLATVFGFPGSNSLHVSRFPSPVPGETQTFPPLVTILDSDLLGEESLFVTSTGAPGCFFGQLERISKSGLEIITNQMRTLYEKERPPPMLYADVRSHVGHFGVVKWSVDQTYYRVRIQKELTNEVEVFFVDYGTQAVIPRCDVWAPLVNLSTFGSPALGIDCKIDDVKLSEKKWSDIMYNKVVHIKIGSHDSGIYTVSFTQNPINFTIQEAISKSKLDEVYSQEGLKTPQDINQVTTKSNGNDVLKDQKLSVVTEEEERPGFGNRLNSNNEDRKNRNGDTGRPVREGFTNYLHPNANRNSKSDKDRNWRSGNGLTMEVIRNPRGPPPATQESTKGPVGFQRNHRTPIAVSPESQPSDLPNPKAPSTPTEITARSPSPTPEVQLAYPAQPVLFNGIKGAQLAYVNSLYDFFVHPVDFSSERVEVESKLASHCSDPLKLTRLQKPLIDLPCIAKYIDDGEWYRGKIIKILDGEAEILFVDYGNRQITPLRDIMASSEELVEVPPQGFQSRLASVSTQRKSEEEDKNKLEEYFNITFQIMFAGQDKDGKYRIRLVTEDQGNRLVLNELFGAPVSTNVSIVQSSYSKLPVPVSLCEVSISKFFSLGRFFLKPANISSYEIKEEELDEFYSSLGENELIEDEPVVGLPCIVRCSEFNKYFRSQILSINADFAKTIFVDHGYEQLTPINKLKRILPQFMQCPVLAWECKLQGVMTATNISSTQQQLLYDCFKEEQILKAYLISNAADQPLHAELTHSTFGNLKEYLLHCKVAEIETPKVPLAESFKTPISIAEDLVLENMVFPYVKSPTEFWIHNSSKADKISAKIQEICSLPDSAFENFKPREGIACLARFGGETEWYRAVVLEKVGGAEFTVQYVDYGNISTVNLTDLRGLPIELASEPPLAVKCSLEGAQNVIDISGNGKSKLDCLKETNVKVVKKQGDVLHVFLYSLDGVDITQQILSPTTREQTEPEPEQSQFVGNELIVSQVASREPKTESEQDLIEEGTSDVPDALVSRSFQDASSQEVSRCVKTEDSRILITYAKSPGCFWAMYESRGEDLKTVQEQISAVMYETNIDQYTVVGSPVAGEVYAVRHPNYNEWYRGRIIAAEENAFAIYFVDYGDTSSVSASDIRELPIELKAISDLAMPFAHSLPECYDGWPAEAVAYFEHITTTHDQHTFVAKLGIKIDQVQYVEFLTIAEVSVTDELVKICQNSTTEVEEISIQSSLVGVVDILTTVTELTEFESELQITATETTTASQLVPTIEITSVEDPYQLPDQSRCDVQTEEIVLSNLESYADKIPELERNFTPGQKISFSAEITSTNGPEEIWILMNTDAYVDISNKIANLNITDLPLLEPQVGRACLSCYLGEWYRATVIEVLQNQVKVFYVDFGNVETVELNIIRRLPSCLAELPCQAVKCALDGVKCSSSPTISTEECKSLLDGLIVTVVFVSQTPNVVYVRLIDENGVDLNGKLGLSSTLCEQTFMNHSAAREVFGDVTMYSLKPDESRVDPEITGITLENTVTDSHVDDVKADTTGTSIVPGVPMGELLNVQSESIRIPRKGSFGPTLIPVPESDHEVIKSTEDVSVPGSSCSEPVICNLAKESSELIIVSQSSSHSAQSAVVDHIMEPENLVATTVDNSAPRGSFDELCVANPIASSEPTEQPTKPINISEWPDNKAKDAEEDSTTNPGGNCQKNSKSDVKPANNSEEVVNPAVVGEIAELNRIPASYPVTGQFEDVVITHASETDHFWVQYGRELNIGSQIDSFFYKFFEEADDYRLTEAPVVGELYAIYYSNYANWFRGRVTGFENDYALIFFVDFGDTARVLPNEIRNLPTEMLELPPLAHECRWLPIAQDSELWTDEAKEALTKICTFSTTCQAMFQPPKESTVGEIDSLYLNGRNVIDLIKKSLAGESIDDIIHDPATIQQLDAQVTMIPIVEAVANGVAHAEQAPVAF